MTLETRAAGVLLHPTSLPSGTLADARRWLDFLHAAGVRVWQMLPLGLPLGGLSPYQCVSAFAVNPALFPAGHNDMRRYRTWHAQHADWLDDYARFVTIKAEHAGAAWTEWPHALRDRDPAALVAFDRDHAAALDAVRIEQYRAALYWEEVRTLAWERDIRLFGDLPIFIAHDSADVWTHRHLFLLDAAGHPTVVAGVPPDYFSATGQRWGNPHYDWDAMQADHFAWWRARVHAHLEWFDMVRIDHFRGLAAAWTIPADEPTAVNGRWQPAPGAELLQAIEADRGHLPLVAEDLGVITPDVVALRHRFGLSGMAVLQFAFDTQADNPHKPENVGFDTVYYTGTHDNDTTCGWWASQTPEAREIVMRQLEVSDPSSVPDAMVETVLASRATLAILPLQDVLHLGSEARMNTPGTAHGNWRWRFAWDDLAPTLAPRLRRQLQDTFRCETPRPS